MSISQAVTEFLSEANDAEYVAEVNEMCQDMFDMGLFELIADMTAEELTEYTGFIQRAFIDNLDQNGGFEDAPRSEVAEGIKAWALAQSA